MCRRKKLKLFPINNFITLRICLWTWVFLPRHRGQSAWHPGSPSAVRPSVPPDMPASVSAPPHSTLHPRQHRTLHTNTPSSLLRRAHSVIIFMLLAHISECHSQLKNIQFVRRRCLNCDVCDKCAKRANGRWSPFPQL